MHPEAEARPGVMCLGQVRTLSEVMRSEGITHVHLLKIDVEGDELAVLMGLAAADWPKIQQV
jgi:FkbM family methyltransferase